MRNLPLTSKPPIHREAEDMCGRRVCYVPRCGGVFTGSGVRLTCCVAFANTMTSINTSAGKRKTKKNKKNSPSIKALVQTGLVRFRLAYGFVKRRFRVGLLLV